MAARDREHWTPTGDAILLAERAKGTLHKVIGAMIGKTDLACRERLCKLKKAAAAAKEAELLLAAVAEEATPPAAAQPEKQEMLSALAILAEAAACAERQDCIVGSMAVAARVVHVAERRQFLSLAEVCN
ncbi:hypothetical protein LTR08_002715 [Meristemomyces frigidus]|nr:hypothetical protein LTR08_002715 [Meristemomyces frigidus]